MVRILVKLIATLLFMSLFTIMFVMWAITTLRIEKLTFELRQALQELKEFWEEPNEN